jgi:hypothetical protein
VVAIFLSVYVWSVSHPNNTAAKQEETKAPPNLHSLSAKNQKKGAGWGSGGGESGSLGTTEQHQNLHFSKTEKKNKNKKGASPAPATAAS